MRPTLLPMLLLCAAAIGCQSNRGTTRSPAQPAADWSEGRQLLDGLDVGRWGEPYHVGDQVLLGLQAIDRQRIVTRYLLVTMTDEADQTARATIGIVRPDGTHFDVRIAPPTRLVSLATFDEQGKLVRRSRGAIYERTLNHGLYFLNAPPPPPATVLTKILNTTDPDDDPAVAPYEAIALAVAATLTFAQSSGSNPVLGDLVQTVIQRPSLFRLLSRPTLAINMVDVALAEANLGGDRWPATKIRFEVRLSDQPALTADVLALPPAPPLGLVSGIVAIDGQNPTDPNRRLHVQLLAARRGSGAAIDADRLPGLTVPLPTPAP